MFLTDFGLKLFSDTFACQTTSNSSHIQKYENKLRALMLCPDNEVTAKLNDLVHTMNVTFAATLEGPEQRKMFREVLCSMSSLIVYCDQSHPAMAGKVNQRLTAFMRSLINRADCGEDLRTTWESLALDHMQTGWWGRSDQSCITSAVLMILKEHAEEVNVQNVTRLGEVIVKMKQKMKKQMKQSNAKYAALEQKLMELEQEKNDRQTAMEEFNQTLTKAMAKSLDAWKQLMIKSQGNIKKEDNSHNTNHKKEEKKEDEDDTNQKKEAKED